MPVAGRSSTGDACKASVTSPSSRPNRRSTLTQIFQQVPAVGDLEGLRRTIGSLGVGGGVAVHSAQQNALNSAEWLGQDAVDVVGMFGGDVLSSAVGDGQDFVQDRWRYFRGRWQRPVLVFSPAS